jgi:phage host-nuclease inhibitor protein Gam
MEIIKTETTKHLHEIILELFYFESKDKPCKLTKKDILWKLKDPSVSEYRLEEVLNWMVHHKKLNETLGEYTIDRFELIDLEQKFKNENQNQAKSHETVFYANYNTTTNIHNVLKPKPLKVFIQYIFPAFLFSYIIFIFFQVNKLNNSFEIHNNQIAQSAGELKLEQPRTGIIKKKAALSDQEVKQLFANQHQNILYLNKTIDSLQKQINKANETHAAATLAINKQINSLQPQVNAILLHTTIVLLGFVLLFFMKNTTD